MTSGFLRHAPDSFVASHDTFYGNLPSITHVLELLLTVSLSSLDTSFSFNNVKEISLRRFFSYRQSQHVINNLENESIIKLLSLDASCF